jgi:hypothetical protein
VSQVKYVKEKQKTVKMASERTLFNLTNSCGGGSSVKGEMIPQLQEKCHTTEHSETVKRFKFDVSSKHLVN